MLPLRGGVAGDARAFSARAEAGRGAMRERSEAAGARVERVESAAHRAREQTERVAAEANETLSNAAAALKYAKKEHAAAVANLERRAREEAQRERKTFQEYQNAKQAEACAEATTAALQAASEMNLARALQLEKRLRRAEVGWQESVLEGRQEAARAAVREAEVEDRIRASIATEVRDARAQTAKEYGRIINAVLTGDGPQAAVTRSEWSSAALPNSHVRQEPLPPDEVKTVSNIFVQQLREQQKRRRREREQRDTEKAEEEARARADRKHEIVSRIEENCLLLEPLSWESGDTFSEETPAEGAETPMAVSAATPTATAPAATASSSSEA